MKKISKFKTFLLPALFLALSATLAGRSYARMAQEVFSFSVNQRVIMIDAGHGGWAS